MSPADQELYDALEGARQRLLTHHRTWRRNAETKALQAEVEELLFAREEELLDGHPAATTAAPPPEAIRAA